MNIHNILNIHNIKKIKLYDKPVIKLKYNLKLYNYENI